MKLFFAVCTLGALASAIRIQTESQPVVIQTLPDGSFEVFSPICGVTLFTSNPLRGDDTYHWDGDNLLVTANGITTEFPPESVDHNCGLYGLQSHETQTEILEKVQVEDISDDGRFSVRSNMCMMNIWLYEPGDEYEWERETLIVFRDDDMQG